MLRIPVRDGSAGKERIRQRERSVRRIKGVRARWSHRRRIRPFVASIAKTFDFLSRRSSVASAGQLHRILILTRLFSSKKDKSKGASARNGEIQNNLSIFMPLRRCQSFPTLLSTTAFEATEENVSRPAAPFATFSERERRKPGDE